MHKSKKQSTHLPLFILMGVVLFILSNFIEELRVLQGITIAVYVIAISSIILLTGYSGQVSLGHGALMAIGAYAAAVLRLEFNLPVIFNSFGRTSISFFSIKSTLDLKSR